MPTNETRTCESCGGEIHAAEMGDAPDMAESPNLCGGCAAKTHESAEEAAEGGKESSQ